MKKYHYVQNLSWKEYKAWEGRMILWTEFLSAWDRIAIQYVRDYLGISKWHRVMGELSGLTDYE